MQFKTDQIENLGFRPWIMAALCLGLGAYLFTYPVILQSQEYHQFADQRGWFLIPHFWDVVSNLPFLIIGLMGIRYLWICQDLKVKPGYWAWMSFFVGVALVAPGSAYYHWNPNDQTLVWDRLPMTVGFMGVFCALTSEIIHPKMEKFLGWFLALGMASVVQWAFTGDLRLYVWVQALCFLSIILLLVLYPKETQAGRMSLILTFVAYALAKLTENRDAVIFDGLNGWWSGHTIKHLLAAMAVLFLFRMLKSRKVMI